MLKIGDHIFKNKDLARDAARSVMGQYHPGDVVTDKVHHDFLLNLLALHPDARQKIGCGVKDFYIGDGMYGTNCFWLMRLDGTMTDWSFLKCLSSKPSNKQDVLNAMRLAVWPQICEYRDILFAETDDVFCPVTGEKIGKLTCHIDHIVPFKNLVESFLTERGLAISDIKIAPSRDAKIGPRMSNNEHVALWLEYHRTNARLRALSPAANMQKRDGPP